MATEREFKTLDQAEGKLFRKGSVVSVLQGGAGGLPRRFYGQGSAQYYVFDPYGKFGKTAADRAASAANWKDITDSASNNVDLVASIAAADQAREQGDGDLDVRVSALEQLPPQTVVITDALTSADATQALSANQGKVLNDKIDAIEHVTIVDATTDTSVDKALSANQGKVLNDKIDALDQTHITVHDEVGTLLTDSSTSALSHAQGVYLLGRADTEEAARIAGDEAAAEGFLNTVVWITIGGEHADDAHDGTSVAQAVATWQRLMEIHSRNVHRGRINVYVLSDLTIDLDANTASYTNHPIDLYILGRSADNLTSQTRTITFSRTSTKPWMQSSTRAAYRFYKISLDARSGVAGSNALLGVAANSSVQLLVGSFESNGANLIRSIYVFPVDVAAVQFSFPTGMLMEGVAAGEDLTFPGNRLINTNILRG